MGFKRIFLKLIFTSTLLIACQNCTNKESITDVNDNLKSKTKTVYDTLDYPDSIIYQSTIQYLANENTPITRLTKINNLYDDITIAYTSGLTSKDGLKDYILDSIFYDSNLNDTLTKHHINRKNSWVHVRTMIKQYDQNDSLKYVRINGHDTNKTFTREIFYKYDLTSNKLIEKKDYECNLMGNYCDSLSKATLLNDVWTKYIYRKGNWVKLKKQ